MISSQMETQFGEADHLATRKSRNKESLDSFRFNQNRNESKRLRQLDLNPARA